MAKKSQAIQRPIFWITGNLYEKKKMWNKILTQVGQCKVKLFDSDLMSAAEMSKHFSNQDIFSSEPQIYKIKGLPQDYTVLNDSLGIFRNDCVLVIDARIGYYDSGGNRFCSVAASNFYKNFKKFGKVIEYPTEFNKMADTFKWCRGVVSELEKTIEQEAIELLVKYKGINLDILYSELFKLSKVCDEITPETVENNCVADDPGTIWLLIDELSKQKYDTSIEKTVQFLENCGDTVSAQYGEIFSLIMALSQYYLFILFCKDQFDINGFNRQGITESISKFKKVVGDKVSPIFSSQYCYFQLNKRETETLMQLNKSSIYMNYTAIMMTNDMCRLNSSNGGYLHLTITSLIAFLCRKTTFEHFTGIINYKNQHGEYTWQSQLNSL